MSDPATPQQFEVDGQIIERVEVQASMTDGVLLRGYRYQRHDEPARGRRKPNRSTTPLLCVPRELGNTRDYEAFALSLMSLPQAPLRLYAVDMRGRGRSEFGDAKNSSTETDGNDLISVCDALGLHHADILVSGRSAFTVFLTAPKRPGLFRKLILNDGGPEFDGVGIARQSALARRIAQPGSWSDAVEQLKTLKGEQFPRFTDAQWLEMAHAVWRKEGGGPAPDIAPGLVRLSNAGDYDSKQPSLWSEFKLFRNHPALFIRGELSPLITHEIARKMTEAHPKAGRIVVPQQGHIPVLASGELPRQILEFLVADDDPPRRGE